MSASNWTTEFLDQLLDATIAVEQISLPSTTLWQIESQHWQQFATLAIQQNIRWAAGWAEHYQEQFFINACFEKQGLYVLVRTILNAVKPELPSQAAVYPAANRSERHTQDMFGINFVGHPDNRRWTRHKAWTKHHNPLRKDFPVQGEPEAVTPPDIGYPFVKAYGAGVYEIPVGPVHAGIIEPGHFRFQAVGEMILNLEERLGYVHKGIEKIAEGRTPESLARLAGRVSGDTTVGHCWAACRAMEQAAGIEIPPRAALIRGILAERERIANHLGDIGAICNDVGFVFAQMQLMRLRELWLRSQAKTFGHRLLMDCIIPGGVNCDLPEDACLVMEQEMIRLKIELDEILLAVDMASSLEDRLYTAGYLAPEIAAAFGALGYVGRASGQKVDVRRDAPYAPYDQVTFKVPLEKQGDIASRFWMRSKEIDAALKLIKQFIGLLSPGDLLADWKTPLPGSEGLGIIEGWRGEIIAYIRFDSDSKIARFYPRDPSAVNWPVLEKLVLNNIVPDFPVCNKSVNGSYSGNDL
ncbi:Formate hydrogenlyase subunit 5 [Candidatus Methylobacter favarea]|uniref:Formate hydrogenlyase subunit 5 n=1 Tax=Candidatus Methylobacter favarea TaxID=2707345 RepID=A0A8S0WNN1_9GAMM|nr:NADH-quinone oxidoreductase subunit C [Candidatus Methylobacter favarea]CAA9890465.1 Formate hydrogenlyase subunit 5 [Candidatus Methylobacter favarea]